MKKILATDLDGTLLFPDKKKNHYGVREDDLLAIQNLHKDGVKVIVATGRNLQGVSFLEQINLPYDYLVLSNGAFILDKKHKVIKSSTMGEKYINDIFNSYIKDHENQFVCVLQTGKNSYRLEYDYDGIEDKYMYPIIPLSQLSQLNNNVVSMNIFPFSKNLHETIRLHEAISEQYKDINVLRNTCFIDIVNKDVSKGNAIKHIMDSKKLNKYDLYCIGDSWNDESMFQITENSFTFFHAEPEIQKLANNVVKNVSECIELLRKK